MYEKESLRERHFSEYHPEIPKPGTALAYQHQPMLADVMNLALCHGHVSMFGVSMQQPTTVTTGEEDKMYMPTDAILPNPWVCTARSVNAEIQNCVLPTRGMCVRMCRITIALATFAILTSLVGCERYALDRQMEELCKKDGGIKVYETVTLSPVEYDKLFNYVATAKTQEGYYGPEYRYLSDRKHMVGNEGNAEKGRGELIRIYSAIYRQIDNRLLGESVWYARGGGDLFTFGFQPSSNSCPRPRSDLAQSIFVKGE